MNERGKRLVSYALARLQEASTWRGVVLALTGAGIHLNPEQTEAIIAVGLLAAGLIGAAFPDGQAK